MSKTRVAARPLNSSTEIASGRAAARSAYRFFTRVSGAFAAALAFAAVFAFARPAVAAVAPDYVLISPPKFVNLWTWYIGERAKVKTDYNFAVKSTADIYNEYPYGDSAANRNPAESIHAYIRAQAAKGTKYFVLGGNWINAQDLTANGEAKTTRLRTGLTTSEMLSLENAVPGILAWTYTAPTETKYDLASVPSDLFYACTEIKSGTYPWDPDGDGMYVSSEELAAASCDFVPDVVVSRMSFKPWTYIDPSDNQAKFFSFEALVTNYVAKLARGESPTFGGLGGAAAVVGNVSYEDIADYNAMAVTRMNSTIGAYRRLKRTQFVFASDGSPYPFIYDHDWDFAFYVGHCNGDALSSLGGNMMEATQFYTDVCTGLVAFVGANIPCQSAVLYAEIHADIGSGEQHFSGMTLGEVPISSPFGGALVSVNNTSYGQLASTSYTSLTNGISDEMLTYMTLAYFRDGTTAGEAWRRGIAEYATLVDGGKVNDTLSAVRRAIVEEVCFGDPLVKAGKVPAGAGVLFK